MSPKVRKSKLSEEDVNKLHSKCEPMNQEFKFLADKAEEREQCLEKKIAQLQEDLERLDGEKNKELNECRDMMNEMKDMMKEEYDAMKKERVETTAGFMQIIEALQEKRVGEVRDLTVKNNKFRQTIEEMEAKADVDKAKIMELQGGRPDWYDKRSNFRSREDSLLIMKLDKELAEQENLRARIIGRAGECPKCAERFAALEVSIAACQRNLESEMAKYEEHYDRFLEQNRELQHLLEDKIDEYDALKKKYDN